MIALILAFGCTKKNNNPPEGVLNREEMAKVMMEVHILESKIYKLYLKKDSADKLYKHYEQMLFDSLKVDEEQFDNSLEYYYSGNLKEMHKVYEIVVDSLLAKQKTSKN